jgi:transcriptional regulator with XRE-family HTH domain
MNESIGTKLRQARELRRLTLQQVSETTKVRPHYLQALENDDLSAISSAAQARGFLRIYADFLGLNVENLLLVKSPVETSPAPQPSISSPDHLLASSQGAASNNMPKRPGLLANLLNRFMRRKETEIVTVQTTAAESAVEIPVPSEPIPYVPARATEVLPAVPDSPVEEPLLELKAVETQPTPAIESTPTVRVPKKIGSRLRKSSTPIDKQSIVKKKEND